MTDRVFIVGDERTVKVGHLEDARPALCRRTLQLWRMYLNKTLRVEVFSEELADGGL